ncbi:KEOPS complex subunit Bud32 [uncultured archaeon]|nr:KEOPS complex subunit Bud32 [uncultured archaeon]
MRRFSGGAEAEIFETEIFGKGAVVKVRCEKKYRIRELDVSIRRTRTRREAKLLHKARMGGVLVPRVIALGKFSIYMEKLSGTPLKDTKIPEKGYGEIGRLLARMHNAGIVHGDFTPANIMVCGDDFYVIDFGLAEDSRSSEERAIDLLLMKRSVGRGHYKFFESAYAREADGSKETLARLSEVELRGRYQIRTLT